MIYLIKAEETNLYKIGYTAGTTESRIKTMQTGCPYELSIIKEVDGSLEKEKWLHKTFKKYRSKSSQKKYGYSKTRCGTKLAE